MLSSARTIRPNPFWRIDAPFLNRDGPHLASVSVSVATYPYCKGRMDHGLYVYVELPSGPHTTCMKSAAWIPSDGWYSAEADALGSRIIIPSDAHLLFRAIADSLFRESDPAHARTAGLWLQDVLSDPGGLLHAVRVMES